MKNLIAVIVSLVGFQASWATHQTVTVFRAPIINHVQFGHAVQTYSYGYAPAVTLYSLPPTVTYQLPVVQAAPACPMQAPVQQDPPPVPADPCPATQQLFQAAPVGYSTTYASFGVPAYSAFRFGIGNYGHSFQAFRTFNSFTPRVSAFRTFNTFNTFGTFNQRFSRFSGRSGIAVRAPGVNVRIGSGLQRFSAPRGINQLAVATAPGSTTIVKQQNRTGLFGLRSSSTTTVINR